MNKNKFKLLDIRLIGDDILRKDTLLIDKFDIELQEFVSNMIFTMKKYNGAGLAAPQVGISKKIFVINVACERKKAFEPMVFINPEIIEAEGNTYEKEGCLSIPDIYESVQRSKYIKVIAKDVFGNVFEYKADNFIAKAIQHEMDHLNGIVFIDKISGIKKLSLSLEIKKIKESANNGVNIRKLK